jgi:hypothetical protein
VTRRENKRKGKENRENGKTVEHCGTVVSLEKGQTDSLIMLDPRYVF